MKQAKVIKMSNIYGTEPINYIKKKKNKIKGFILKSSTLELKKDAINHYKRMIAYAKTQDQKEMFLHKDEIVDMLDMSGPELLYTKHALGMSTLLIEKLRKVVSGKSVIRNRVPVEWSTLRQAKKDAKINPRSSQSFGPEGILQFESLIRELEELSRGGAGDDKHAAERHN